MAEKFLTLNSTGDITQQEATQSSAGVADAGKIPALASDGKLSSTMMPTGVGADTATVVASEDLVAGDFVNLYADSGTIKCRKADATSVAKRAMGFVLSAVTSGANATVYFGGQNTAQSGLTVGAKYFLSATVAGDVDETVVSTAGHIVQEIGIAISATTIPVRFSDPVVVG